jgi:hypothetical protein
VHSACQSRVGARASGDGPTGYLVALLLLPQGTCSSGLRYGPVSDAEGSRASEDGAPPWTDATWTARMCSGGVGDTASEMSDQTMAGRPNSAAEFSRIRDLLLAMVLRPAVPGFASAWDFDQNRSAVPGHANGGSF